MKIKIISVGKIKEKFAREWQDEFLKRIKKWAKLEIIELKESGISPETKEIQAKIKSDDYNILLAIKGVQKTSEDLSAVIKRESLTKTVTFIIGGPDGVGELKGINETLSISKMTFTHQMARVILIEQIYRALSIIKGIKYHK